MRRTPVGASVLPFMVAPGWEVYWLLGLEHDWAQGGSTLCDFGGKTDCVRGVRESPAATAARELGEESLGLLRASPATLPRDCAAEFVFVSRRRAAVTAYSTFLVQVEFDPTIPHRFAHKRVRVRDTADRAMLEKQRLVLLSSERLRAAVAGEAGATRLRESFVRRAHAALEFVGR